MKRPIFQGLTAGALSLLSAPFALAHPGHDHSHTDHAVHELPAQSNGDILPLIAGLIAICTIGVLVRSWSKKPR